MSKLQKTTTPRREGILDTVIRKVQAVRLLFTTEYSVIPFHSFVVVVLAVDCSHPGDGKESPIATSEGMPCILI